MSAETLISLRGVGKKYCRSLRHSMLYGLQDVARDLLGLPVRSERLRPHEFWALHDLNVEIHRGECLGILGPNGVGKSTILKMIAGIFKPDTGSIRVRGRVGSLIEVSAGFHPMLTGRENIYVNGSVLGMRKSAISRKFDAIVEFSGLKDFLDVPVKYYSTGMHMRLGFAIAVHVECDILLVDEVLAVGDVEYQAKCVNRIASMIDRGTTIILVSHQLNIVEKICPLALLLGRARPARTMPTPEAISIYRSDSFSSVEYGNDMKYENGDVKIENVSLTVGTNNIDQKSCNLILMFSYKSNRDLTMFPGIAVHDSGGTQLLVCRADNEGYSPFRLLSGETGRIQLEIPGLRLLPGFYRVSLRLYDSNSVAHVVNHEQCYSFEIKGGAPANAYFSARHTWKKIDDNHAEQ